MPIKNPILEFGLRMTTSVIQFTFQYVEGILEDAGHDDAAGYLNGIMGQAVEDAAFKIRDTFVQIEADIAHQDADFLSELEGVLKKNGIRGN